QPPSGAAGSEAELREALNRANASLAEAKRTAESSERERAQLLAQIEELRQNQREMGAGEAGQRIASLEAQLRDTQARHQSLEEEQEELLIALAKTEIENNNLKERLRQIDPSFATEPSAEGGA